MTLQETPHPAVYPGLPSLTASAAPAPDVDANPHRGAFRKQGVRKRIYWRGQVYPSISAAAKAAGVSRQSFSEAIKRNRVHMIGTGPHKAAEDRKQPCAAHGWHWPSQKDAADALGVAPGVVSDRLNRGTFYRLVLERLGINSAAAGLPPPVDN